MNTDFSEYLDRITESDEFGEIIDPNQIGPIFNSAVDAFAGANKIEDKTELYNQASKRHNDWKHKYNVTRFIPTGDDFDTYYEKFESPDGKLEDKIKYVDEWINRSVDKASSIRPTERDDFRNHLVMLGNNYIREEAAKEATPGWVNDKLKRIIQSPIKPVYDIFDWEGSQRFFAENLVENPEMDEDLSSKFAAGIGELGSQLTIGAALYASGAGASIPYVFGALYGTRYFNEGFRQELDRTGDAERAVFHGITQLPAAALDTFSDVFLLKSGSVGKTFYKEFLSATTEEAKRNVLKRAIPSVLKEGGIQFTSEGIIGGAMADASSGVGSFLATGDQKYLDNALSIKNLAESAFIEGTLGGVAGVGISSFAKEENLQNLSNQIRTLTLSNQQQQSSVLGMLKTKDYDGVLKFLEENKQVENENDYDAAIDLLKEERRINTSGQKTNKERVAESDIKNFEYERFLSKKIDEIEKISNKEEREFRQQDIDRYNNIIKSIKDGSFTEKTEFESDIDLDAASRYTWKGHNPNKDTDTGAYETLLDNGELSEDGVIYIEPNKFINQKTFNALSMEHGKDPSIIFSPNKDTAKVIIPGTNNGSQEFRSSTSPKKGWIAISSVFDGGKSKVKILGTVSEYNKINFKPGDYEITSRDSDSITVKTKDGKSHKLTGDSRNFVSDQQDYLKSKENTKILKREEETFNEAGALYEQALTKREWSEKEKQDFLSKVDKAVDFLGRLADTEINPEFQDAYLESAIQLLDAKERLSKINVKKSNIAALFEPIESDYNEIEEQEVRVDSSSAVDISTTPIAQSKKKYPHTLSLDDTIETAENRGVYYDGKQGKIINDNGDYVFVSNSGTQYTLTRNKDITLRDAGVSVSRKNPQKPNILKPIKATKPDRPNIAEPFEGDPKEIPPQTEEEQPSIQPEPSIRLPYINHALKLARSIDNRLNGDYLVNNKFTKEEIDIISKEAGVDVSDIQDDYYSIADRINSKLGREQEKADKIKDREFEVTGDKLNPNSYRNFRKSLNTKEHNSRKRKIITELQDKYNYKKVTIIDSVSDIPKELMEDGFEDADAIVDKDGRIYFVLENIAPEQGQYLSDKIEKLFAHELVGHLGVSGLLKGISQKSYDSLVKLLKNHNDGSIWNYIKEKYKGQEEYILIEEALAFIAERKTPEYVSLFQRIIDLIRVSLAKAGLKNWSKNDVNSLIRRAFVERKFDKGLGFDPRVIDSTPRSVTRGSRVSYGDIANHTLKGSYGAWIDKSGNMIIVNGDAMSFPHYEAALKELKEEDSQDISGVYERMYEKGYVSIRKNNGEGYVESGIWKKLTSKQKAVLEGIGINDEVKIVHDIGFGGLKTIYSPTFGEFNKDIRYSKADLLSLPDSALSKTGKEFATIVDNMRRSDGSTFIKKETKTPEQLNEIAKEIITLAKNNPEYFTVKINPEKLIYDHLFQDANGKIDMDDPIDSIRASEESKMLWSLFKDGRIKEYAEKEAIELTNQRNITLRENASYLAENPEYTNFESAQILIAMSKIAIKDLPNGEYQSVEISSGNRQAVMPLDGEYASYIRDEIRNGKTAKVAVKDGYIAVQENAKLNNKSIKNGWIMLNKSDNSEDAAKLAKLCSGTGWCVSNNNTAASYLSRGDFWIYFKDGRVQIGIGYISHGILERPRGTLRGQSLSEENEKIAEQKIRIDKIKGGEDFLYDRDLKKKLYKILKSNEKPTIEEIKDFILLTDKEFDVIINFKTYSYTKDTNTEKLRNLLKDKISKLFEYSDFIKTNEDGSIHVLCSADLINSKVLEKIQSVGGDLRSDSLTEAPLLQSVGRDLFANSLTEAPLLQSVGGDLRSDSLTKAPLLQSVGGYLHSYSLTKAPLLQSVGGNLFADSLTEAPFLQSVGGDLRSNSLTEAPLLQSVGSLHSDSLTKAPLLQSVGGNLRSNSLTEAPLLQSVGGYLHSDSLTEAPLLQSVGGSLRSDSLTKAPLLQSVGGYLHSYSLTKAPLLQSVGGYLSADNLTEAPLLKSVGRDLLASSLKKAPLLQSVGGGLIADNLTEAPFLQSVGRDLYTNNLTEAPLLQSVGRDLSADSLTEAPLLQSVGRSLIADSLTEAPLLKSVGGGLSASSLKHAPLLTNVNNKEFTPIDNINKDIRYSKTQTEEFNESLFDSLTYFSDKKIEDRREISKLKGAKLEQKLIIGEKSVLDALKSINHLYLDSNHLDRYKKLLANFVDTRRRVDNPPLNREELNNITVELAEIARHQNEQIYTKYRQEFPDIDSENFRDEDGNLDMEKLHDWFKSRIALDESLENPRLVSENHKEYIDAVYKLQEQLLEDINNPDSKVYDLINNTIATETDDPILKHGNTIINERFERIRDYLKDFVNQTVSFDPKDATFKEVRLQYYSLMSILGDGYPLNNGTFISSRIKEIFENEGNFINPFSKRSQESYITNVQSFGTKLRSLVADGKTLEFLYGIISPFREGITESQRWTNDVARPYIESALKRAEKINGRHFNNYDRIKMGIYSILRQHGVDEHPGMALRKNIEWIKASINNYRNSYDKTFVRAAEEQSSLLELLTSGIDFDSDYAILNMEENAKEYLGDGAIQFVDDLVKLFNQLKPLSRLTTEFIYGRKFNEIVNYLPTMQIITKGSHYAEVDFADLELTSDGDSILRSNVGVRNIINTSGMSSTQDRMRKIGENRAIVLDIVHMADNAGRLNSIDYFTSFERKEIQGMQNSRTKIGKQLAKFFGDEKADLGRVSVFNNATRTMWHNEIENSSFIAPIQGVINKLINLWSRSKLSSIHQFFTQTASNYIPFIIRNISNPKKIGYSIDAANLLTRYNLGLLPDNLNKIIERITYEIRHRVQDVVLEKSVSLNVSGKEIKDWINGTSLYHSIKHLDSLLDKIMFAPFKGSDYLSGAPILLSEYLDREISNNRATSFEDMTYNQESHMIAVDEMERFIGIGNASRRGDWLHNKNGMISVARNLLVAFSSHRINNATNFAIEAKKLMEDRVNGEEKINSIKYMTGIAAQSIVFNGLKAVINFMIAKLIIKALRSDDDDDLKSLYESTPTSSKEERRLIDAEISLRRKLRKQVNNIRNRASDKNIIAINMGKDMVYNMFIPINAIDGGADMLIHYFYDKHSEELFKENKKNELQRLRDEYKKEAIYGDTPSSLSIKQEISDLESQVYIPVSFESRSVAPLGGSYGGVVKGIEDFLSRSTDYFIKGEPVSMADMLSIASILGASQPDLLKAAKEFEKLSDAKLERDEKIQEIKEEEEEPFFVF